MENATEKNVIIESNKINPHPGEEFVGVLLRKKGGKWRAFVYAKKAIFLEEFRPTANRLTDFPREIIDLTEMKVEEQLAISGLSRSEQPKAFRVTARNGKVLLLMASTMEEKSAWVTVLQDQNQPVENVTKGGLLQKATSSIAPVRRRQISIQDLKRNAYKKAARIECDTKGNVLRYNDAAETIFGYTPVEMIGQSISKLVPESVSPNHHEYFSKEKRHQLNQVLSKYRKVQAQHRDGHIFEAQIRIEITPEGNYLANLVEVNRTSFLEEEPEDPDEYKMIQNLRVKLIEAKNLAGEKPSKKTEKQFDPYCVILIDNERKATTTSKLATTNPFWGEDFFFDDIGNQCKLLKVVINNQNKSSQRDPRHGLVAMDLKSLLNGRPVEKWHSIMPVKPDVEDPSKPIGSMRVKVTLICEKILPFQEYSELLDLILDDELTIFNALASVAGSQLEEIAGTLVNIFAMENRVVEFIHNLTIQEIVNTDVVTTLFRANSLTSKVIDLYMKIVGMNYLHAVLTDLLIEVYDDKESCEIDPTRLEKGDDLESNGQRLLIYVNRFFGAIASSVDKLPPEMACVFENIRAEVVNKWPTNELEKYTSVSGFIFLRFFCPAILDPNLFGIMDEHPVGNTARTLTLIAKTLQNLANLVEAGVEKEPYMEKVNPFIKENMERMKSLINRFCKPTTRDINSFDKVDQRNLRRELSALHRYFADRLDSLREHAKVRQSTKGTNEEEKPKVAHLFEVIEKLEERHKVFDAKMTDSVRRPNLQIDAKNRHFSSVIYENKPHTPY